MHDAETNSALAPRASRFARRLAGETMPRFADLQRKSRLDLLAEHDRDRVAALVALLDARPALDSELNGSRLGALAAAVGEAEFDLICDAEIASAIYDRGAQDLPQAHALERCGEELLQSHERSSDMAQLVSIAADICAATEKAEIAA